MINKDNRSVEKLIYTALFSTLVFIGTQFIKIPLAVGYLNVGDCFVLLSGWIIGGGWAMLGAGIGAGLADLLSGYVIYAPVTVIIKAIMALISFIGYKLVSKRSNRVLTTGYIISGIVAEIIMVIGYYLFEGCLYSFQTAGIALIGNLIQGAIAIVSSVIMISILEKTKVIKKLRM